MNENIIEKIKSLCEREDIKKLLIVNGDEYWYNINKSSSNHLTGFCYLCSEVFYALNGKWKKYWFKKLVHDTIPYQHQHYFLQDKETGEIIDITKEQFDFQVPYELGKNIGKRFISDNGKKFIKILKKEKKKIKNEFSN
jgi:6-phosphogluconolactonase/glucosamine-6-phosphate isomerase/deaminase